MRKAAADDYKSGNIGGILLRYFANLQAMRGIAALMVLLIHAVSVPGNMGIPEIAMAVFALGPAGVDIFFVISGFIITILVTGRTTNPAEFLVKRAVRIYPVYWLALAFALIMVTRAPVSSPFYVQKPLWSLALLLEHQNYLIQAAWSLSYEMYFYLVVAIILLVMPRRLFLGLAIWAALTGVAIAYGLAFNPSLLYAPIASPLVGEFLLGVLVAILIQRGFYKYPVASVGAGVLWFLAGAVINHLYGGWENLPRFLCFGPGAALMVYGVIAAEMGNGWTFSKPWQRLGDASYSLYIWHQPVYFALHWLYGRLGLYSVIPAWLLIAPSIAVVFAIGFASYRFIERPSQRFLLARLLPLKLPRAVIGVVTACFAAIALYPALPYFIPQTKYEAAAVEGAGILSTLTKVVLPSTDGVDRRLLLTIEAEKAGSIFVGYLSNGGAVEASYPFSPGEPVAIDLANVVDGPHLWVTEMEPTQDARLVNVEMTNRPS